jgi:anti-sigma B factor antagonist
MISSRTPEGYPNRCPVCGKSDLLNPSLFSTHDATCPHCGSLLWFDDLIAEQDLGPVGGMQIEEVGDVTIVRFLNQKMLREQSFQVIGERLFDLVDNRGKKRFLLDFGLVEFISSAALGTLITLNKKVQLSGGELALLNIRKELMQMFAITKLDKLFKLY